MQIVQNKYKWLQSLGIIFFYISADDCYRIAVVTVWCVNFKMQNQMMLNNNFGNTHVKVEHCN